ncbi:DUF3592 domain-containing protein [Catellatospora citrea]|uniref:DUF3592 domain-containing protein n=1 Tax=Catellatospora citrea TaxID=53366 RepID=A0A8J3KKZ6_9ACTN|nr:DUF3592 domain-containing protein [Catellatospora citrea]RKE07813.1 hypothetical protein C8E86_2649 [Catellatospora citrea]GIG01963.1 hypothetical protein Cci01nite_70560 [Catellatospora citrea]
MNKADHSLLFVHAPLTGTLDSPWRLTVGALIALLTVVASLVVVPFVVYDDVITQARGVLTTGTVSAVSTRDRNDVTVRLPALDGREVAVNLNRKRPVRVGDRIEVRYDPKDLDRVRPASAGHLWATIFGAVCGIVVLLGYAWRDMTLHRRIGDAVNQPYREGDLVR